MHGIVNLSCVATSCCASLHKQHFFVVAQNRHFEKDSSVYMKIFIRLNDLQADLPGVIIQDFFPFGYVDDKVWNVSSNPHAVS